MGLYYRSYGKGAPVIILHGLYGSSDNWISFAKSLGEHFQVYLPDQRNHGHSFHSGDHTFRDMSDDLDEFIRSLQLQQPVIIGHSMGGKTAMTYALRFPDKIAKLIAIDIGPQAYDEGYAFHANILNALNNIKLSAIQSRHEAEDQLSKSIQSRALRQYLLKNLKRNSTGYTWKINIRALLHNLPSIMGDIRTALSAGPIQPFQKPTCLIKGERSSYLPNQLTPDTKQLFPQATLITIPKTGHWIHAEQPEQLKQTIINFLSTPTQ